MVRVEPRGFGSEMTKVERLQAFVIALFPNLKEVIKIVAVLIVKSSVVFKVLVQFSLIDSSF